MKKSKFMLGLSVLGAAAFAFTGCSIFNPSSEADTQTPTTLSSSNNLLGMGAVTTVELLGSQVASGALQALSSVQLFNGEDGAGNTDPGAQTPNADGEASSPVEDQAETFNKYFSMLDSLLGDDVIATELTANTDAGYENYAYKLVIKGKDMTGADVTHLMYYNETQKTAPADTSENTTSEQSASGQLNAAKNPWDFFKWKNPWKDHQDSENKTEYVLDGVMVIDETDYVLRGTRSAETEEDETENEIEICAYLDGADSDTFVRMKQETSVEEGETEKEYVYTVFENGKLIETTAVEFETETQNDKEKVQYKIAFLNEDSRGIYTVERRTIDGESVMRVGYIINGKAGVFFIRQTEDGQYEYTFESGRKKHFRGRNRHEMPGNPGNPGNPDGIAP